MPHIERCGMRGVDFRPGLIKRHIFSKRVLDSRFPSRLSEVGILHYRTCCSNKSPTAIVAKKTLLPTFEPVLNDVFTFAVRAWFKFFLKILVLLGMRLILSSASELFDKFQNSTLLISAKRFAFFANFFVCCHDPTSRTGYFRFIYFSTFRARSQSIYPFWD